MSRLTIPSGFRAKLLTWTAAASFSGNMQLQPNVPKYKIDVSQASGVAIESIELEHTPVGGATA
jgi:hypothetical protein